MSQRRESFAMRKLLDAVGGGIEAIYAIGVFDEFVHGRLVLVKMEHLRVIVNGPFVPLAMIGHQLRCYATLQLREVFR